MKAINGIVESLLKKIDDLETELKTVKQDYQILNIECSYWRMKDEIDTEHRQPRSGAV